MTEVTTVGVDLAKEVIVLCGADRAGRPVLTRQFTFEGFARGAAVLAPCTFGLEACSSAHHWARGLAARGHVAKLMAPDHVKPFRLSARAKNDVNDARAILSALQQPTMRFVATKSAEAQAMLAVHKLRQGYAMERTVSLLGVKEPGLFGL